MTEAARRKTSAKILKTEVTKKKTRNHCMKETIKKNVNMLHITSSKVFIITIIFKKKSFLKNSRVI